MPMKIQILGIGCHTCRRMETDIKEIVARKELDAVVERVEDLEKILQFRVTALPGLVIDDRLISCGYAGKEKIERILTGLVENK
jgi:small redox-active disulfide protein 2